MPIKIINVKPAGAIEFIHDDRLAGLIKQGKATIERASHVEVGDPAQGQDPLAWYASMVKGPVLGPYGARQAALDAEVEWINRNILTPAGASSGRCGWPGCDGRKEAS